MWIFGYGSLMWNPGFEWKAAEIATLIGYQRSFCIFSHYHRGTPDCPGLVLGLDPKEKAICQGIAYEVDETQEQEVLAYLHEREMCGYAYTMCDVTLEVPQGRVCAFTFVADPDHAQYAGELAIQEAAQMVMKAKGAAGLNRDYLINTVRKLETMGIVEAGLHALLREVEVLTGLIDQGSGI